MSQIAPKPADENFQAIARDDGHLIWTGYEAAALAKVRHGCTNRLSSGGASLPVHSWTAAKTLEFKAYFVDRIVSPNAIKFYTAKNFNFNKRGTAV